MVNNTNEDFASLTCRLLKNTVLGELNKRVQESTPGFHQQILRTLHPKTTPNKNMKRPVKTRLRELFKIIDPEYYFDLRNFIKEEADKYTGTDRVGFLISYTTKPESPFCSLAEHVLAKTGHLVPNPEYEMPSPPVPPLDEDCRAVMVNKSDASSELSDSVRDLQNIVYALQKAAEAFNEAYDG